MSDTTPNILGPTGVPFVAPAATPQAPIATEGATPVQGLNVSIMHDPDQNLMLLQFAQPVKEIIMDPINMMGLGLYLLKHVHTAVSTIPDEPSTDQANPAGTDPPSLKLTHGDDEQGDTAEIPEAPETP